MALALSDRRNGTGDIVSGARASLLAPPDFATLAADDDSAALESVASSFLWSCCLICPSAESLAPDADHAAAAAADRIAAPTSPSLPTEDPLLFLESGGDGHGVSGSGVLAASAAIVLVVLVRVSVAEADGPAVRLGVSC